MAVKGKWQWWGGGGGGEGCNVNEIRVLIKVLRKQGDTHTEVIHILR